MIIFVLTVIFEIILRAWTFGIALGGFSGKGFLGYPKLIGVLQLFFGALVGVSTPNQAEKNAYFSEVFKWGHSMGSFVRVWKIIRIDEPGLLK